MVRDLFSAVKRYAWQTFSQTSAGAFSNVLQYDLKHVMREAMRYSKDHKAETHARIVKNASERLRERGAASLGVADLMREAGLTHGGFYAHFASREALIGEAFAHALQQSTRRLRKWAALDPEEKGLAAIVDSYLSADHRADIGDGCALPSLSTEVFRASSKTRKVFAENLEDMISVLIEQFPDLPPAQARREAIATISTMMGAMILARATEADDFSDEILGAGRYGALRGEKAPKSRSRKSKPNGDT